jgi:hypothetical protein
MIEYNAGFEVFQRWLRRMASSEMWRLVCLVRTDVSEESVASFFLVEKSACEKMLTVGYETASQQIALFFARGFSTLKMEATSSSKTSILTRHTSLIELKFH